MNDEEDSQAKVKLATLKGGAISDTALEAFPKIYDEQSAICCAEAASFEAEKRNVGAAKRDWGSRHPARFLAENQRLEADVSLRVDEQGRRLAWLPLRE